MDEQQIYIDGQWLSKSDAKLSVFDHGVLYGDGVFEGIRAYHGHVFRLPQHMTRLWSSAEKISLKIPISMEDMSLLVKEAIKRNHLTDAYIRLLVTRGVGDLGLDISKCPKASIVIIADKLALYPKTHYEEGLKAAIVSVRRTSGESLDPTIKSMNYLNLILAKVDASKRGVSEAILLNQQGYVAECSGDNIFFIKDKTVITPPVSAGALDGITRGAVIELVTQQTSYQLQEFLFKPERLYDADEVFFTGTAAEIIPVTQIDGKSIGTGRPGKITQELIDLFKNLIQTEAKTK